MDANWLAEKEIKVTYQDFTWLDLSLRDIAQKADKGQLPILIIEHLGKNFVVMTHDDFMEWFGE